MSVRELPEELAHHRLWLRSLGVGMQPIFRVCDKDGTADLAQYDPIARTASFLLCWKSAGQKRFKLEDRLA